MSILIKILLIILFFLLPLVNSRLLNLFGIDFSIYINGNYEFTKVMFFNILSGIIIILFLIKNLKNLGSLLINKKRLIIIFSIILLLIISSLLSFSPYLSIFGNAKKAHGLIMFINLIGIFTILINTKKPFLKKLILTTITSIVILSIITIKEYYFPTFNYGELGNRAIGTFGHPNYIALFLLMIIPIFYKKIKQSKSNKILYYIFLVLIIFTLFLTKTAWGIILFILYNIYYYFKNKTIKYKNIYLIYIFILFFSLIFIIFFLFPEKLHSFLSRFFIWKSTLKIIFSDIKILLFGGGFETLSLTFDNYKSIYLYIFENIGFTADRPHNLLLNIFYHIGFFGLILFIYLILNLLKNFRKKYYIESIILFLLFTIFNFASISSYLLLVLFLSVYLNNPKLNSKKQLYSLKIVIFIIIAFISISGIYFSINFYIAETYAYKKNHIKAHNTFLYNPNYYYKLGFYKKGFEIEKFKSEKYYLSKIKSIDNIKQDCLNLTNNFSTTENYFYCGEILKELGYITLSKDYYKLGLNKLPDLWNKNSKYFNNIIIKNYINGNRFFSKKYSNIKEILDQI